MKTITLKDNQAAIILETSPEGEIHVEMALPDETPESDGFVAALCMVIARKLIEDEAFQEDILSEIDE
ncbi:MAG: twitching motility protein [Desulfobulbaceae bacterium]|nr:twitching motility protein [Desulfobulbaceae bacterium]